MVQPIKIFSHGSGPNPWKVKIILEELQIPYEAEFMDFSVLHTPVFEKYNPNGRVPAIIDPNTGITLWESGAIIEYLIDTYDKDHKLSPSSAPDSWHAKQWLYFQASGQGPYFGQAVWFTRFHAEQLPSARERYMNEIKRVTKVLDSALQGKEYLVGNKLTYADLAFIPWYWRLEGIDKEGVGFKENLSKDNPAFGAWFKKMLDRPLVKKIYEAQSAKIAGK